MDLVSCIVAEAVDFPDYSLSLVKKIPIVRRAWIQACVAAKKLQRLAPYSPTPEFFLSGVNVTCKGIPVQDMEAIYGGVQAAGGRWSTKITAETTHIVTLRYRHVENTPENVKESSREAKVVRPSWIDDSLKLRCRLDESHYLVLPRTAKPPQAQSPSSNAKSIRKAQVHLRYKHFHKTKLPEPRPHIFTAHTFYLSKDIPDTTNLLYRITASGGTLVQSLKSATVFIGMYRDGTDYITASRERMWVGTPIWIYSMLQNNKWTSPLESLLHYPMKRGGITGMQGLYISISGYAGNAREYLKNLIEAAGAIPVDGLRKQTTHLIASQLTSEKCKRAKQWHLNLVNHLWLEESFRTGAMEAVTNERYIHFVEGLDLSPFVGATSIGVNALRVLDPSSAVHSMRHSGRNPTTVTNEVDFMDDTQLSFIQPEKAPKTESPQSEHETIAQSELAQDEPLQSSKALKEECLQSESGNLPPPEPVKSEAPQLRKSKRVPKTEPLQNDRIVLKRKLEDSVGASTSKRRNNRIDDSVDISMPKRENSVPRPSLNTVTPKREGSLSAPQRSASSSESPPESMDIICTGLKIRLTKAQERALDKMGIHIVEDPKIATHVIARSFCRTQKFLIALSTAPTILTESYLLDCLSEKRILPTQSYLLMDREIENKLACSTLEILSRARLLSGKLLQGYTFNLTPGLRDTFETFSRVIGAHGGVAVNIDAPSKVKDCQPSIDGTLYLISTSKQRAILNRYKALFGDSALAYPADCLLMSILRMEVSFNPKLAL